MQVRVVFGRSLLAAALTIAALTASPARGADLELLGTAWAAGSAGLLRVRTADDALRSSGRQRATVAVDNARLIVWADSQPNFHRTDFDQEIAQP